MEYHSKTGNYYQSRVGTFIVSKKFKLRLLADTIRKGDKDEKSLIRGLFVVNNFFHLFFRL